MLLELETSIAILIPIAIKIKRDKNRYARRHAVVAAAAAASSSCRLTIITAHHFKNHSWYRYWAVGRLLYCYFDPFIFEF